MVEDPNKPKDIRFVYERARHHRTLHADGAWSAVTPHAEVQISFYNDLRRMPVSVTIPVREDNTVGPGEHQEITDLVREVDVTVVMNVEVAKAAVALLSQMIAQAEPILQKAAEAAASARQQGSEEPKVDTHG